MKAPLVQEKLAEKSLLVKKRVKFAISIDSNPKEISEMNQLSSELRTLLCRCFTPNRHLSFIAFLYYAKGEVVKNNLTHLQ
jgi:hypothetical protein